MFKDLAFIWFLDVLEPQKRMIRLLFFHSETARK